MLDPNTSKIRKDVVDIQGTGFVSATHSLVHAGLAGVQRGLITLSTNTSANVTITSVDTSKSILNFTYYSSTSSMSEGAYLIRGTLTSATNINFTRGLGTPNIYISWELITWR